MTPLVFYQDETTQFLYQVEKDKFFVHYYVLDWSFKEYKKALGLAKAFRAFVGDKDVFTVTRNYKFAEILGGVFEKEITIENETLGVFKWEWTP